MKSNKIILIILIITFMGCSSQSELYINNVDFYINVGNEQYNVSHPMLFKNISITQDYIFFNTTGFYINAPNQINITLHFINVSIAGANETDLLLNFTANTTAGFVWFNISGFTPGVNYSINRSGPFYNLSTANASGFIIYNNTLWGHNSWYFEVFVASSLIPPIITHLVKTFMRKVDSTTVSFIGFGIVCGVLYLGIKRREKENVR